MKFIFENRVSTSAVDFKPGALLVTRETSDNREVRENDMYMHMTQS